MNKKLVALALLAFGVAFADGPLGTVRYKLEFSDPGAGDRKVNNAVTRAYLGYAASLNDNVSAKVVADVAATDEDGTGKKRYAYLLKNALGSWSNVSKDITLKLGLFGPAYQTQAFNNWGYNFIVDPVVIGRSNYKTGGSQVGVFLPSADLGAEVALKINGALTTTVGVLRGDGYKNVTGYSPASDCVGDMCNTAVELQFDVKTGIFLASFGSTLRPHLNDEGDDAVEASPNLHVGVKTDRLRAGYEAAATVDRGGKDDDDNQIFSTGLYGVFAVVPGLEAIARAEYFCTSADDSSIGRGFVGVGFLPAKKFKIVLHYDLEGRFMTNEAYWHTAGLASEFSF